MSSWGSWPKISKLAQLGDFSFFGSKSSHVQSVILNFANHTYKSLRGPAKIYAEARSAEFDGTG